MKNKIQINIWDDFWDDEHVPLGKKQETYAYVEGELKNNEEIIEKSMDCLYRFIENLSILKGVTIRLRSDSIRFENITHKILDSLMSILNEEILLVDGYELSIYSES